MTHLVCPKCKSNEHTCGYGLAAGPMGSYCYCDGCDILLEAHADTEGLPEELITKINENLATYMKEVWGETDWEKHV